MLMIGCPPITVLQLGHMSKKLSFVPDVAPHAVLQYLN